MQPDKHGFVSPDAVRAALRPDTALVSVMTANNELGTIQPVREIAPLRAKRGIVFHTDAVRCGGISLLDVRAIKADILTLSAHKFGGPKGAGAITSAAERRARPLNRRRARARRAPVRENVAGIVGLARALELSAAELDGEARRLAALRQRLTAGVLKSHMCAKTAGDIPRLPGIANFSFAGIEGEYIAMMLDNAGIAVSPGSACAAGGEEPSHVLTSIGLDRGGERRPAHLAWRENTPSDVDVILEALPRAVEKLRAMSPRGRPCGAWGCFEKLRFLTQADAKTRRKRSKGGVFEPRLLRRPALRFFYARFLFCVDFATRQ